MAETTTQNGFEVWTIKASDQITQASFVPERGGTGVSLVMPGPEGPQELLYVNESFWNRDADDYYGGWPFLFPICGRVDHDGQVGQYQYEGQIFRMPIHGFAPTSGWESASASEDTLVMMLEDSDATRALYPFKFRVILTYRVEPGMLWCEQEFKNRGDSSMPYYAGFHPYFRTPPPGQGKEQVQIEFTPKTRLLYNARLTEVEGETEPTHFPHSITDPDLNEQLHTLPEDHTSRLMYPNGAILHMDARGQSGQVNMFPYVQLFTIADEPFFCTEPWMGTPNGLNTLKRVRKLRPGASERAVLSVRLST